MKLTSAAAMWRTPGAADAERGAYRDREKLSVRLKAGHQVRLSEQVNFPELWATPRAGKTGGKSGAGFSPTLEQQALWPLTATADNTVTLQENTRTNVHYVLNPAWVETLMGFPAGYTDGLPDAGSRNMSGNRRASSPAEGSKAGPRV